MISLQTKPERYQVHTWGLWHENQPITSTEQLHGGEELQLKVSFRNQMIDKTCVLGIRAYAGERVVGLLANEETIFPDVLDFDLVSKKLRLPENERIDRLEAFLQEDFSWVAPEEEWNFLLGKKAQNAARAELKPKKDGFLPVTEKASEYPSGYLGDYEPCKALFRGMVCFVQDGEDLWIQDGKYRAAEKVIRENGKLCIPLSTVTRLFGAQIAENDAAAGYMPLEELAARLGAYSYEDRFGLGVLSDLPYDYSETYYQKRIQYMVRLLAFERPKAAELMERFIKRDRPRSLGTQEELERAIRLAKTNRDAARLSDELLRQADAFMNVPVLHSLQRTRRDAAFETAIVDYTDILTLYWAYLATQKECYLLRLKEHVLAMANLEHWYGDCFFLMTSRALVTLALAYDFIGEQFTAEERETLLQAMVQKGFLPAMKLYYGQEDEAKWPWCIRRTNWNFISNSGVIFAACTVFDTHEQRICADVLEKAIQSLEFAMIYLAPNGELIEGLSYGAYSWNYIILALQALESHFGTASHLDTAPGEHLSYMVPFRQIAPTGVYSQGDGVYYSMNLNTGYTMWWARRMHDHGIQTMRMRQFIPGGNRVWFTDLLWFDEQACESDWSLDYISESTQSALSRSDWGDRAAVLGIHAGDNTFEHSHADLGTFDFEVEGVRFAKEMGLDKAIYCVPGSEYAKTKGYDYYISRAEGHNVYVINPDRSSGQRSTGRSEVRLLEQDAEHVIYEVDMEPAYREQVKAAKRRVGLTDGRKTFLLEDELVPMRGGDKIYWFWHTPAKIEFDDPIAVEVVGMNHVLLTKDEVRLHLVFSCNVPFRMRKGISIPLETSPTRFDQLQTPGIICQLLTLVFETTEETIHLSAKAWKE